MESSFLPTVVGWYLALFGLLMLVKHEFVKSAMEDVLAQRGLYFVLALLTFVIGLLVVVSHNVWTKDWQVAITIFGWALLVGGLVRLYFSEAVHKSARDFLKAPAKLKIIGAVFLAIGVYLLIHVYYFK